MKTLIKATAITLALSLTTLYAGSGHSHDDKHEHSQLKVNQEVVKKQANKKLARLVKNKKIEKSWSSTPIQNIEKKQFNHTSEWVVSYENKNVKNKMKQTLYIFVTLSGKIAGVNYTGK